MATKRKADDLSEINTAVLKYLQSNNLAETAKAFAKEAKLKGASTDNALDLNKLYTNFVQNQEKSEAPANKKAKIEQPAAKSEPMEEDSSSSSSSESDSDSEDEKPKAVPAKAAPAKAAPAKKAASSSSESESSDSSSESEDEKPTAKPTPAKAVAAKKKDSSSSESSSEDSSSDESEKPKAKPAATQAKPVAKKAESSSEDSSSDDSSSEDEKPKPAAKVAPTKAAAPAAKKASSSSSSSSSSDSSDDESSEDEKPKAAPVKKSAAPVKKEESDSSSSSSSSSESSDDEEEKPAAKPAKTQSTPAAKPAPKAAAASTPKADSGANVNKIYVKGLPWTASEEEVREFFQDCGAITSCELPLDENGRSSGTAYVKFSERSELEAALALDGQTWKDTTRWLKIVESSDKQDRKSFGGPIGERPEGCDTVFVGNLPWDVTEEQMRETFAEAGEVSSVRFATGEDGNFRGFGHVQFYNGADAENAIKLAGRQINGRAIRVDYTPPRNRESFGGPKSPGRGDGGRGRGGGRGDGGRGGRGGRGGSTTPAKKSGFAVGGSGKKTTFDE